MTSYNVESLLGERKVHGSISKLHICSFVSVKIPIPQHIDDSVYTKDVRMT